MRVECWKGWRGVEEESEGRRMEQGEGEKKCEEGRRTVNEEVGWEEEVERENKRRGSQN